LESYRSKKHHERKAKRNKLLKRVFIGCLAAFIAAGLILNLSKAKTPKKKTQINLKKAQSRQINKKINVNTIDNLAKEASLKKNSDPTNPADKFFKTTAIGLISGSSSKARFYQSILLISPGLKKAMLIKIDEDTVTNIPGLGYEKLRKTLGGGNIDTTLGAFGNLTSKKINDYLLIESSAIDRNVSNLFLEAKESSFSSAERIYASARLKQVKIEVKDLPCRKIKISNQQFLQPGNENISKLIGNFYQEEFRLNRQFSVELLNGSGLTGAASKVGIKLIKKGYLLTRTANAKNSAGIDDFSFKQTQISYDKGLESNAEEIRNILGAGVTATSNGRKKNISIILGADMKDRLDGDFGEN
jgi:hypothetical protein